MIKKSLAFLALFIGISPFPDYAFEYQQVCAQATLEGQTKLGTVAHSHAATSGPHSKMILARPQALNELIDINTANSETLQKLPSIGPKRAAAIIKYRESLPLKRFTDMRELYKVPGISKKCFERMRAYAFISSTDNVTSPNDSP